MFSGNYDYKVDEKGRVPVPPRFRQELKGEVILTAVAEKCITAYSAAGWQAVVGRLAKDSIPSAKLRKLKRAIIGAAYEAEVDGQGRVVLPFKLRSHAAIGESVVVVGNGDYFEIWQPELWAAEVATVAEEAWQLIETLEKPAQ